MSVICKVNTDDYSYVTCAVGYVIDEFICTIYVLNETKDGIIGYDSNINVMDGKIVDFVNKKIKKNFFKKISVFGYKWFVDYVNKYEDLNKDFSDIIPLACDAYDKTDINEWNYIKDNDDINVFIKACEYFIDYGISDINYDSICLKITMCGCASDDVVEIIIDGNVKMFFDEYISLVYGASVFIEDNHIYFVGSRNVKKSKDINDDVYFSGVMLKWRKFTEVYC